MILSGEMMLRHLGWNEAADLIVKGMDGAIAAKQVTYDFARLMDGATELKTSEFADAIIKQHVDTMTTQSTQSSSRLAEIVACFACLCG